MQQAEIYNGHARRFQQMARHIELSMTPQHQQKHGGPDPISTNDITLATTLLNSVYGYPAGKQAVLALSAGLLPGEERSQTVRGLFRMAGHFQASCEVDARIDRRRFSFENLEFERRNFCQQCLKRICGFLFNLFH